MEMHLHCGSHPVGAEASSSRIRQLVVVVEPTKGDFGNFKSSIVGRFPPALRCPQRSRLPYDDTCV